MPIYLYLAAITKTKGRPKGGKDQEDGWLGGRLSEPLRGVYREKEECQSPSSFRSPYKFRGALPSRKDLDNYRHHISYRGKKKRWSDGAA